MQIDEAIRQSLGRGLSEDELAKVVELAQPQTFPGGDLIVRQFDRNSDLIIILEGRAQIRTFREELICEVGPGSIIGEMSLVDEQPRSANVRAVGSAECAVIHAGKLHNLLRENPTMASIVFKNIATTLCSRLRVANIHLDGLMGREQLVG